MPSLSASSKTWIKEAEHHEKKKNKASEIACYKRARTQAKKEKDKELYDVLCTLIDNLSRRIKK